MAEFDMFKKNKERDIEKGGFVPIGEEAENREGFVIEGINDRRSRNKVRKVV